MEELKPCPFCGAIPVVKWEPWKEISEDCGVFALNVTHERNCFFSRMCGLNMETRMIADDEETLIETWNTRKE